MYCVWPWMHIAGGAVFHPYALCSSLCAHPRIHIYRYTCTHVVQRVLCPDSPESRRRGRTEAHAEAASDLPSQPNVQRQSHR
ncbi:hypothetical protein BKA56DRAFT_570956 [Ilyonectria sp. MPI-CAGE-AT-0026]|nr:hypothetical protein BKA56DRAFT_570956 [Ilyonectria sp. MPI-CAGE-AT-0026]